MSTTTNGENARTRTRTRTRDTNDTDDNTRSRSRKRDGASGSSDSSDASKNDDGGKGAGNNGANKNTGGRDAASSGGSKGSSGRKRRRRGRRGRGGKGRGSGGDQSGNSNQSEGRSKTEKTIQESGTRLAAKKQRRGGGGGGGGGGGRRDRRPGGVPEEVRRAILEGPPRTMLVSSHKGRTQIAVMEDRTLVEHNVTHETDVTYVGNIYMARVQNVLPGMEAAFLDIGKGRNGVLYAGEVLFDELDLEEGQAERIENVLKKGQKVLVQVTKDPMGTKGPRLTMHLSLAGRYMVLAPNSDLFGISRKLTDDERDRLRKIVKKLKPKEHGVIVRTAAEDATEEQITADLERLLERWAVVEEKAKDAKALTAVYEEPPLVVKVIRDNFGPGFERCLVDDKTLYQEVRDYLDVVAPELLDKVELYEPKKNGGGKPVPLLEAYNVADQLRKAMDRKVWLPSGGYLIIEETEAMKVIDVNTGKFTGGGDTNLEEVVLKTNLEAAEEIVRQLRLRDMGGIIVIDFIDMLLKSNQDQVIRRLKRELLRDRTKTRVSEVSKLGLVQMTRKNVSQGLLDAFSHTCKDCQGTGRIIDLD